MKYTLYIILDPKLNKGQRIAQAAHAAVETTRNHYLPGADGADRQRFEKWLEDPKVVCLVADNEET